MGNTNSKVNVLIGLKTRMDGMAGAIGGVTKLATGVLGVVAAYASLRRIAGGSSEIVKLGAELKRLNQQTDISVSKGLILRRMFEDVGVEGSEVRDIIQTMQEAIIDAGEGLSGKVIAFRRLNINLAEFRKLDPASQFELISKRLSEMDDGALRTFTANEIFSEKGKELMPLFRNGGALDQAKKTLGEFPAVLERNADLFGKIDLLVGRLPEKGRQFFAGVLDQTAKFVEGPLEKLSNLDLTPLGQRVGAFIGVAFKSFEDGTIFKLIALTIEAGFELGLLKGRDLMHSFVEELSTPGALTGGFIEIVESLMKAVIGAVATVTPLVEASFIKVLDLAKMYGDFIYNAWAGVFEGLINGVGTAFESVMNKVLAGVNKIRGVLQQDPIELFSIDKVDFAKREIGEVLTFQEAFTRAQEKHAVGAKTLNASMGISSELLKEFLGVQEDTTLEVGAAETAYGRLLVLMDEYQAKRVSQAGTDESGIGFGLGGDSGESSGGGDPTNLSGEIVLADSITTAVGGAFDYLEGRAVTFGSVMADIGGVFADHFKKGLVDTVVNYTLAKTKMFAIDKSFNAKNLVMTAASAAKSLVSWIPAATAALVSSFGVAGVIAVASLAGLGLAGFSEGGYTGPGGRWEPAGIVHRDEYVMDKFATRAIGLENLEYMRKKRKLPGYSDGGFVGNLSGSRAVASGGDGGGSGAIFVDDKREALRQAALADDDMRIVEVIKSHRAEIFGV